MFIDSDIPKSSLNTKGKARKIWHKYKNLFKTLNYVLVSCQVEFFLSLLLPLSPM